MQVQTSCNIRIVNKITSQKSVSQRKKRHPIVRICLTYCLYPNLIFNQDSSNSLLSNQGKDQSISVKFRIVIPSRRIAFGTTLNEKVHELLKNEDEIKSSILSQSKEQSNKSVKGKHYAKNYRQKKKEEIKYLQEENRFLKQKVEDLSFRLKETEVELNKFKHSTQMMNNPPTLQNYQTTRQFYMKQIQQLLINPDVQLQKLIQAQKNLRMLNTFSNKHRMDMLNYFMSELLQNLINDVTFYYLDSIIEQKGFWRTDETIPFRKMDEEILAFYDYDDVEYYHKSMQNVIGPMTTLMKNFKSMWKKLYQDYLNIIQQGSMLQSLYMPYAQKFLQENTRKQVIYSLKLQLYFEKIKYRKDMRQLRESWFKQFQKEEEQSKMNKYRGGKKVTGQNK